MPSHQDLISPVEALRIAEGGRHALIDARAQSEFMQGAIPGFANAPILTDGERHQVGLTYKQHGQDAAIALGHRLVDPVRGERVRAWQDQVLKADEPTALVTCWRGGLRSQITCAWLAEADTATMRVAGGYKAMRQVLLETIENPPPVLLLAGLTGSGKTRFLRELSISDKVDLEALACHRGSSFGACGGKAQPSQATFENALAMALRRCRGEVLIEDESVVIGSLHIPSNLRRKMQVGAVIYLDVPLTDRVSRIHDEYVLEPLREGMTPEALQTSFEMSVMKVSRRLGGALTADVLKWIKDAFSTRVDSVAAHHRWITSLLQNYYDRSYTYAFEGGRREVIFRGTYEECRQWTLERYG